MDVIVGVLVAVVAASCALAATGCKSVRCGAGTIEKDGECVAAEGSSPRGDGVATDAKRVSASDIVSDVRVGEAAENEPVGGGARFTYKKPGGDPGGAAPAGSYPQASGGSCAAAQASYVEDYAQRNVPPDVTSGAYQAVVGRGTYLDSCDVPPDTEVMVCAAVQNGRAVGVTVSTKPTNGHYNSCIRSAVFGLAFPAHPRLDVTTVVFRTR